MRFILPYSRETFEMLEKDAYADPKFHALGKSTDDYVLYSPQSMMEGKIPFIAVGSGIIRKLPPGVHKPHLAIEMQNGVMAYYTHIVPRAENGQFIAVGEEVGIQDIAAPSALLGGTGPRYWHMHLTFKLRGSPLEVELMKPYEI